MVNELLFPKVELPRAPRIKRMHVVDAGNGLQAGLTWLQWECGHCGYTEQGHYTGTVTEHKRGEPCPKCNADIDLNAIERGKFAADLMIFGTAAYREDKEGRITHIPIEEIKR